MNIRFRSNAIIVFGSGLIAAFSAGCEHEATTAPVASPVAPQRAESKVTVVSNPTAPVGSLGISEDILKACKISFNDVSRAPKFAFDQSVLEPQDRDVLT